MVNINRMLCLHRRTNSRIHSAPYQLLLVATCGKDKRILRFFSSLYHNEFQNRSFSHRQNLKNFSRVYVEQQDPALLIPSQHEVRSQGQCSQHCHYPCFDHYPFQFNIIDFSILYMGTFTMRKIFQMETVISSPAETSFLGWLHRAIAATEVLLALT